MSDYADFCREQREHRQATRRRNAGDNEKFVTEMAALGFTVAELGAGFRFSRATNLCIDFWPSTGKWSVVGTGDYRLGGRKMVEAARALIKSSPAEAPKWTGSPNGPSEPPWEQCPCAACKEKLK